MFINLGGPPVFKLHFFLGSCCWLIGGALLIRTWHYLELQIKRSNHTLNPRVVAIMEPMDTTLYLDKVSCFKTNTACSALVPVITSAWPACFLQASLPKYDALIAIIGIQRWILVGYGGFLKWGYPQFSSIYRWVFRSKRSSIFGVPPFQETPICFCL